MAASPPTPAPPAPPAPPARQTTAPRAQLIHLEVDRRLGHEWDEWDGRPLPNGGNFDAAPRLFFRWSLGWILAAGFAAALLLLLLAPRLELLAPELPVVLGWILAACARLSL